MKSAVSQMLMMPSRAAWGDGHSGNLKLGSYDRKPPACLAMFTAAMCADLQGSSIRLIEPQWKIDDCIYIFKVNAQKAWELHTHAFKFSK